MGISELVGFGLADLFSSGAAAGAGAAAADVGAGAALTGVADASLVGASDLGIAGLVGSSIAAPAIADTASTLPAWLSLASTGASLAGGITGAYGAIQQGQATSAAAKYNAEVAAQNATQATRNAQLTMQSGNAQADIEGQKNRAELGAIVANQAASGVDANSGSNLDVRTSASELGSLNVLTLRSNAAKQAYGYETEATGFKAESELGLTEAQYATAGSQITAGSTLLGAASNASSNYLRYLQSSGNNPFDTLGLS